MDDHRLGDFLNILVGTLLCVFLQSISVGVDRRMVVGQLVEGVDRQGPEGDSENSEETASVSGGDGENTSQPKAEEQTETVAREPTQW